MLVTDRIFVDTNLFLRYLTNDVPFQADAVEQLLHQAAAGQIGLITNSLVIAEIVWTLESFYELARPDIQTNLLAILNTPGLEIPDSPIIQQAISDYAGKNVDFIDAYNVAWLQANNLSTVYTFDHKHFKRFADVTVLIPGR